MDKFVFIVSIKSAVLVPFQCIPCRPVLGCRFGVSSYPLYITPRSVLTS